MALTNAFDSCGHDTLRWSHIYNNDPEFDNMYQMLLKAKKIPNFHLEGALLCHLWYLYVPLSEPAKMILEAHYSQFTRHFKVEKTVAVLQKY